jgi:hypothetical protein
MMKGNIISITNDEKLNVLICIRKHNDNPDKYEHAMTIKLSRKQAREIARTINDYGNYKNIPEE